VFSLRTKLTITLLATSIVSASIVGVVAQWKLFQKFSTAVMTQSFEMFQGDVAAYITKYGSWDSGASSEPFSEFVESRHRPPDGGPRGNFAPLPPRGGPNGPPLGGPPRGGPPDGPDVPPFRFLLLDADGRVLMPNPPYQRGEAVPASLRDSGLPILVDGRTVAIAVPLDTPNLSQRDDAYLGAMRQALLFGIGVASLIALGLGLFFGTTLSRTLRRLTAALQAMSAGDLRQRLETKSRDETGVLADTFNRMSAELATNTEQLKEAVKLREEVDRIARHDMKTPLTTVIGVPRLLREEGQLRPEQEELLGIVERAGYRILNMVNLSLDLYKIEQGTYRIRPELVDIRRLAGAVLTDVAPSASAKGVTTRIVEAGRPATFHAWAEELLCYSLLANLIKNAVEASIEGSTVTITLRAGAADVVVDIHNAGVVPEGIRESFFEKYATAGKVEGTGLGTYSARLMARVQGGEIAMKSSVDEGTTLTVLLPVAPANAEIRRPAEETSSSSDLPALRVLLVDDDEYNRFVLSRYLTAPLVVSVAVNGRDAVDAAAAQQPDVILMDVDMPGMNGLDAARAVREQEQNLERRRSIIIALSSYDDDATAQRSHSAGCDLYLTKPVTRTALHAVLRGLTQSRTPQDTVEVDPDLKDLLPEFLKSREALLDEIADALEKGDAPQVRRLSHRLSGSLSMYGFLWASDQARRLELEAEKGDRELLVGLVAALKSHLSAAEIRILA
jgi:signal transduction histidine kinase/CheY-like chemotaxis protein